MTREEKEKAYDEALKVIKGNLDALNEITETGAETVNIQSIKNCFYKAFPELKESEDSEDEKARKWIYDYIRNCPNESFEFYGGIGKKAVLAWLEKQKDHDDAWTEEDDAKVKVMCKEGDLKPSEREWLKNLKNRIAKQEPKAEWSEEDEAHLKWFCRIIRSYTLHGGLSLKEESELGKWIDKWINHEPQHEKKWSKFDEDCLKRVIWYVENPAPSVVKDTNLVLWLKSLPEIFNLQPNNRE